MTGRELARLEMQGGYTGLSSIDARRLVAEIRRLRQLVIDVKPYCPDTEQTRTMDLPARLKAEVDRG